MRNWWILMNVYLSVAPDGAIGNMYRSSTGCYHSVYWMLRVVSVVTKC